VPTGLVARAADPAGFVPGRQQAAVSTGSAAAAPGFIGLTRELRSSAGTPDSSSPLPGAQ